jgi:chromosome segregation protein
LPGGARPLTEVVKVPDVLARRMSQIGVVPAADGERLQAALLPGQRLVSEAGDLWRWDGFRAAAADAPSAAALRLRQLNRLTDLKRDLTEAEARADGARQAHEHLAARLKALTEADARAREARRDADRNLTEANRRLSRAEADRSIAAGKLEAAELAQRRHEDEATEARARLREAEAAVAALEDLTEARAQIEDVKLTVEAARVTMLSRRAGEGEVRREGEARVRRGQEIVQEASGWKHRLATAGARKADLAARAEKAAAERAEAASLPGDLAARRERLAGEIDTAETRRKAAADRLAEGETALREAGQAARDAERGAGEAREGRARAEALAEAARAGAAAAAERIAEDLDCTPQALLAQLEADPAAMPDAHALEAEVLRLRGRARRWAR